MLRRAFNRAVQNCPNGDIFEFGVASGTTFIWLAEMMKKLGLPGKLVGFDSFKGLPKEDAKVWAPAWHAEGEHAFGREYVEKRLADAGTSIRREQIHLIEGFYNESLTPELQASFGSEKLSLVNVDVDLYISTMQLLEFVAPMLQVGAILYFDDWKDPRYDEECKEQWGEHRAFAEWSEKRPNFHFKTIEVAVTNNRYMEVTKV